METKECVILNLILNPVLRVAFASWLFQECFWEFKSFGENTSISGARKSVNAGGRGLVQLVELRWQLVVPVDRVAFPYGVLLGSLP